MSVQFLRFCAVGAAGFAVDAGILLALVSSHLVDPMRGRLISFAAAVCVTFAFNRRWTFNGERGSIAEQMIRYLAVQGLSFAINLSVYALMYHYMPAPFNAPLFCVGVSCACVLFTNFMGSKLIVFRAAG